MLSVLSLSAHTTPHTKEGSSSLTPPSILVPSSLVGNIHMNISGHQKKSGDGEQHDQMGRQEREPCMKEPVFTNHSEEGRGYGFYKALMKLKTQRVIESVYPSAVWIP